MTTQLLAEAEEIVDKKDLSVDDYNRFLEIGNLIEDNELLFFYDNLDEAFSLRLPEIAQKVGSYSFIQEQFWQFQIMLINQGY